MSMYNKKMFGISDNLADKPQISSPDKTTVGDGVIMSKTYTSIPIMYNRERQAMNITRSSLNMQYKLFLKNGVKKIIDRALRITELRIRGNEKEINESKKRFFNFHLIYIELEESLV